MLRLVTHREKGYPKFYGSKTLGTFLNFGQMIPNHIQGNFLNYHWGFISIYKDFIRDFVSFKTLCTVVES